jgi:glycosyltransferase involved in cell wall biosynthesis
MPDSNRLPPRKRLLVLTSTFPRWKGDNEPPFVYELSRRLQGQYQVTVLAPHASGSSTDETMDGIHIKRFKYFFTPLQQLAYQGGILARLKRRKWRYALVPFFILAQFFSLIVLLRRHRFDVIHAHWILPQGLVVVLARPFAKEKPGLLCTSHGGDLYGLNGRLFNRLKSFVLNRTDLLTVVSHQMRKDSAALDIDPSKIEVVPMGVDLQSRFTPPSSRSSKGALLFVGRLVEKKGVRFLIEAMPGILAKHPSAKLKIAGDGPEKRELKRRISELNIGRQVHFAGPVLNENLTAEYQAANILVFPSVIAPDGDREGFGLVLVEALGCECAVVATDLPAMQDIIIDNKTALVVPQKNARLIEQRVNELLEDDELRIALGRRGRQFVLKFFDWDIIVRKYSGMIDALSPKKAP